MTTDVYPPAKRSAVMAKVKGQGTGPEKIVRGMESTVLEQKTELDKLRKRLDGLDQAA